jgi:hypothetical protein
MNATIRLRTMSVAACAVAVTLAGCIKIENKDAASSASTNDDWSSHLQFGGSGISFDGDAVVISGTSGKARIAPDGGLTIDGRAVTVDATQRAALAEYHAGAMQLRTHAKQVAGEGVDLGKAIVADVLGGIAKGDTSQIEKNAEAKADGLRRSAARLCTDLTRMRGAQDRVTATLAEFRPYATLDQSDLDDCLKDVPPEGEAQAADAAHASAPGAPPTAPPAAAPEATAPAAPRGAG